MRHRRCDDYTNILRSRRARLLSRRYEARTRAPTNHPPCNPWHPPDTHPSCPTLTTHLQPRHKWLHFIFLWSRNLSLAPLAAPYLILTDTAFKNYTLEIYILIYFIFSVDPNFLVWTRLWYFSTTVLRYRKSKKHDPNISLFSDQDFAPRMPFPSWFRSATWLLEYICVVWVMETVRLSYGSPNKSTRFDRGANLNAAPS